MRSAAFLDSLLRRQKNGAESCSTMRYLQEMLGIFSNLATNNLSYDYKADNAGPHFSISRNT